MQTIAAVTQVVPRACVIGGKAAPGYERAKKIIKMVNAVGEKVNSDPEIGDLLKVVFVPDYNVSLAEILIPGQLNSPHLSTLCVLSLTIATSCMASVASTAHATSRQRVAVCFTHTCSFSPESCKSRSNTLYQQAMSFLPPDLT